MNSVTKSPHGCSGKISHVKMRRTCLKKKEFRESINGSKGFLNDFNFVVTLMCIIS